MDLGSYPNGISATCMVSTVMGMTRWCQLLPGDRFRGMLYSVLLLLPSHIVTYIVKPLDNHTGHPYVPNYEARLLLPSSFYRHTKKWMVDLSLLVFVLCRYTYLTIVWSPERRGQALQVMVIPTSFLIPRLSWCLDHRDTVMAMLLIKTRLLNSNADE